MRRQFLAVMLITIISTALQISAQPLNQDRAASWGIDNGVALVMASAETEQGLVRALETRHSLENQAKLAVGVSQQRLKPDKLTIKNSIDRVKIE